MGRRCLLQGLPRCTRAAQQRNTASGEGPGAGGRARGRRGGGCTLAERSGSRVCLLQIGVEEGGSEGKALEIIYMQKKTAGRKEEIEHTGTGGIKRQSSGRKDGPGTGLSAGGPGVARGRWGE